MTWHLGALKPSKVPNYNKPVAKVVSTMTFANTVQLTPTAKSRYKSTKGDTPSLSPLMEYLISQAICSRKDLNKN